MRDNWIPILIFVVVFGSIGLVVYGKNREENKRQAWYKAHECKHEGYLQNGQRLHKCNDGKVYLHYDIPTKEEE